MIPQLDEIFGNTLEPSHGIKSEKPARAYRPRFNARRGMQKDPISSNCSVIPFPSV